MPKYYISTSLPYVNANPHIGFALEAVQADVLARYHRSLGDDVYFLTGSDENSLKNVRKAEEQGVKINDFILEKTKKYLELKKEYSISSDDFIRTTEERHIKGVQKLWGACQKDIYRKKYRGLYCVGCETFLKENELKKGLCPDHKKRPELVEEENYFFKLSKYQDEIKELIEKDKIKIVPETRKNEIISFLNQGLEDICISRSKERAHGWGIKVPGDSSQIIWVWFDALSNYINALGYGENKKEFQEWWEENNQKTHVIGKGIVKFHAVYWIGILLSAGLSLPQKIFVHSYITSEGEKMSKSLGNVVDPLEVSKKYGSDSVRYFLLREIPPFKDGDFTEERFKERYNADLAKGLGNLVARVLSIAERIEDNYLEEQKIKNSSLIEKIEETNKEINFFLNSFEFNKAISSIWGLISFCDQLIEKERVWEQKENQKEIVPSLLYTLLKISDLLKPFMPQTANNIDGSIKIEKKNQKLVFKIKKRGPLFPALD